MKPKLTFILALAAMVVFAAGTVWAGVISVDVDGSCVFGTGQSDPYSVVYCSIQDAIDDAISGDTINVATGTYYEKLIMGEGLTVEGAGVGLSIIDGTGIVLSGNRHGTVNYFYAYNYLNADNAIRGFSIRHKGAVYTSGFPGSLLRPRMNDPANPAIV